MVATKIATKNKPILSTRLRWFRLFYEYSLDEVAQDIGIDRTTLSRVERGLLHPTPAVHSAIEAQFGLGQADVMLGQVTFSQFVAEQGD